MVNRTSAKPRQRWSLRWHRVRNLVLATTDKKNEFDELEKSIPGNNFLDPGYRKFEETSLAARKLGNLRYGLFLLPADRLLRRHEMLHFRIATLFDQYGITLRPQNRLGKTVEQIIRYMGRWNPNDKKDVFFSNVKSRLDKNEFSPSLFRYALQNEYPNPIDFRMVIEEGLKQRKILHAFHQLNESREEWKLSRRTRQNLRLLIDFLETNKPKTS